MWWVGNLADEICSPFPKNIYIKMGRERRTGGEEEVTREERGTFLISYVRPGGSGRGTELRAPVSLSVQISALRFPRKRTNKPTNPAYGVLKP